MMKSHLKKRAIPIGLGLLLLLAFLLHAGNVVNLPLIQQLEAITYDARLRLFMPKTQYQRVVIVDIDEQSLAEEGRWPWSRDRLALLVDKLFDKYGIAVVGFDIVAGCDFNPDMRANFSAANPDAIVAFNPGVKVPVVCHTEEEDYAAGEIAQALPECPGAWVERNGHKARYHILSYLGTSWCRGDVPRFPDALAAGYTRHVMAKGGVVTWDVPIQPSGLVPDAFTRQLQAIGDSVSRDGAA